MKLLRIAREQCRVGQSGGQFANLGARLVDGFRQGLKFVLVFERELALARRWIGKASADF